MLRESRSLETDPNTSALPERGAEAPETKVGSIELDENIFQNLAQAEKLLPEGERPLYRAYFFSIGTEYVFNDLDELCDAWVREPKRRRQKAMHRGHNAFSALPLVGLRLEAKGVKVPWVNPEALPYLDSFNKEKFNKLSERPNLYRSPEDEQMVKLIAKHEALTALFDYQQHKALHQPIALPVGQQEHMEYTLARFNRLPADVKSDLERLATDKAYYHTALDQLRQRLARRLAKQGTAEKQAA